MNTARKYKAIALWHDTSHSYYIKAIQMQAAQDNAPLDSIYYTGTEWQTVGNIQNDNLREYLLKELTNGKNAL